MERSRVVAGLDLHVGPQFGPSDRKCLERLCRHVMRPPVATERLTRVGEDRYRYAFRHPWRDGTVAVEFSGVELVEKLVAITPAPRANLVRYHGTLAPNARLRSAIVPVPIDSKKQPGSRAAASAAGSACARRGAEAPGEVDGGRINTTWAELMARVFEEDVLERRRP